MLILGPDPGGCHPPASTEPSPGVTRDTITRRLLGEGATHEHVTRLGLDHLIELECQVAPILDQMSIYGIAVDIDLTQRLDAQWSHAIGAIDALYPNLNLDSPPQVLAVLHDHGLALQDTKQHTLEPHASHPLVADLLARRALLAPSRFARQLLGSIGPDGRVHPSYDGLGADTGRITAANPPVQGIPTRTEAGLEIRRAVTGGPGRVLVCADYSQVELRILAGLSGEPTLLRAFEAGEDVHERVAAECRVDRSTAKAINYGLLYGQTEAGLARALGCDRRDARDYIERYFRALPRVRAYLDAVEQRALHYGAAWSRDGRCRILPDAFGIRQRRDKALRQAKNHVVQGTAADIYKRALVAVAHALPQGSHIVLTIHDEIVVEAPEADSCEITALLRTTMESAGNLAVPLVVDVSWGVTLADAA